MTGERWQVVKGLFQQCISIDAGHRDSFLASRTSDPEIRSEVERLLDNFKGADAGFLDPLEVVRRVFPRSENLLETGEILSGRFRIDQFIGRGGMGEVYRARDIDLDEDVAVKVLGPGLALSIGASARFRRELQLARRVTHPNVCRLFDINRHKFPGGEIEFFTMELLHGITLAQTIQQRGKFPVLEAKAILCQILAGLQAAHASGIIHRDLKPSNVMLVPSKSGAGDVGSVRAVLMDFGLARLDDATSGSSLTTTGDVLGTLVYISPEQLTADVVTPRTDIYAFGLIWYEMVTGERPFRADTTVADAMQRLQKPVVVPVGAHIPPRWRHAIEQCLERNPDRRPTDITAVLGLLNSSAGGSMFARDFQRQVRIHRRRLLWAGAAVGISGVAVSVFPTVSRFYFQNEKISEGTDVLLSVITNSTGDARLDAITELFRSQLSQSAHLNLIGREQLSTTLKKMGKDEGSPDPVTVREAAWRLNASLSIFGNVSRVGPDYALNVQLETRGSEPGNPRTKSLRSFSASDPAALMRTVRDASLWVRQTVGESPSTIAAFDRLPADVTTPSWEALSFYSRAKNLFLKQDLDNALLEIDAALRIDPKFTLAALSKADMLMSRARQAEGLKQWRSAIQTMDARPVTRAEELNARGMFAFDSGDLNSAERFFRTWALEYPNDWRGLFYRVVPLMLDGHALQALEILQQVAKMAPTYGDVYAQTIACHLLLNQTNKAREWIKVLRKYTNAERADLREAFVRFREGNCAGCLEMLRTIQRSSDRRSVADAMVHEGMLLLDARLPQTAAERIEVFFRGGSSLETAPEQASLRALQAWGQMESGRSGMASNNARQALELETGPLIVATSGTVFARVGQVALARNAMKLCEDLLELPIYAIAYHRIRGEMARTAGRRDDALKELRSAAHLEPRLAHRQYLIDALAPGSPERLELCLNAVRNPWQVLRPPPIHSLGSLATAVPVVANSGTNDSWVQAFERSRALLTKLE